MRLAAGYAYRSPGVWVGDDAEASGRRELRGTHHLVSKTNSGLEISSGEGTADRNLAVVRLSGWPGGIDQVGGALFEASDPSPQLFIGGPSFGALMRELLAYVR